MVAAVGQQNAMKSALIPILVITYCIYPEESIRTLSGDEPRSTSSAATNRKGPMAEPQGAASI